MFDVKSAGLTIWQYRHCRAVVQNVLMLAGAIHYVGRLRLASHLIWTYIQDACHTSSIQLQGKRWEAVLQLSTTIKDLVIAWQWRRIKIWGATNARQNWAISLTLGILQSGRICFSIFFHLAKRILGRHCLQNYLQYALHKIMSNLILLPFVNVLVQYLGNP